MFAFAAFEICLIHLSNIRVMLAADLIPATQLEGQDNDQVEMRNEPSETTPVNEREAFDMTSEDDDLRISNLFGIEMKRESKW